MKTVTGAEDAVQRIWAPKSVAAVGASSKPNTLPWWPVNLLNTYEYAGRVVVVNPKRTEIEGRACVPSIAEMGEPVDVAIITLDAAASERAAIECAEAGVGAVVLPAQGFAELGEAGRRAQERILAAARAHGTRVLGPNTDGVANFSTGAALSIQPLLGRRIPVGEVAVVTQSGATAASLMSRLTREGIGCRQYASVGNESDLGLADFISVALQDPQIKMVLTFIEAIRKPEDFVAVARLAAELGKPIVALKVGRTAQAAERAAAHTGALAGEDRIIDALFASLGVVRVEELSEIVAVAKLHLAGGEIRGRGVGIMSVSGGQAGAIADRAIGCGLDVPVIAESTAQVMRDRLTFGTALNPCDLTGEVAKDAELAADIYQAFDEDDAIDCVVYVRKDLTGEQGRLAAQALVERAKERKTPLAVYAIDGVPEDGELSILREGNVPSFGSAAELFAAIRGLAGFAVRSTPPPAVEQKGGLPPGVLGQVAATELLQSYGVPFPQEVVATTADEAGEAAENMGFPVVMKIVSEQIAHKTEIGGVLLGISDVDETRAAFDTLMERGREALEGGEPEGVLIQQQVTDGVEFIVGLVGDPQFGPFVLVGAGGVTAELLKDVALRPAPVDKHTATEMIRSLVTSELLEGFRGAELADIDALAEVVSSVSRLGAEHAASLAELDVNPVLVRPRGRGVVAVDALVFGKGSTGE